jgi:arylsulfatase
MKRLAAPIAVLALAAGCGDDAGRPHIVLITADALRADHLSVNGYGRDTSPNIDAFARGSWHFLDAVTVIPKTGPSFATFFSGRHPREHGVGSNFDAIPAEIPLLSERLEGLGYRTAGFVSNPNLRGSLGYTRGFDFYREGLSGTEEVNRAFLEWAAGPWEIPTFVWLHYIDPHGPYDPPADLEALFLHDDMARDDRRVSLDHRAADGPTPNKLLGAVPLYQQREGEDRIAAYVARYDAEIRLVDETFGEVIQFLRKNELFDGSFVVFTSDHGESLGEHGLYFEHGWFAYEPSLHVPLMIKEPGQREGIVVKEQVSNLDLLPTLLTWLGVPIDSPTRGRDLFDLRQGRTPLLVENADQYPDKVFGIRNGRWKYLRRASGVAEELYDLDDDSAEMRNLAQARPEVVAGMRQRLREDVSRLQPHSRSQAPADGLDPALRERLEALGYAPSAPSGR